MTIPSNMVYACAIGANFSFALGSLFFTHYTSRLTSYWMNLFKGFIACVGFFLTICLFTEWHYISFNNILLFALSGFSGLGIGDIFLLKAFVDLGPARTLIIFGFQPLIFTFTGYYFLGQPLLTEKLWALPFLIGCLLLFSYENLDPSRRWQIKGLMIAITAIVLDAFGVTLTRYTFNAAPMVTPLEGNFYRACGAVVGLFLLKNFFTQKPLMETWRQQTSRNKFGLFIGAFFGTYLSLVLYLTAIKNAHLATLSGITITGPIFAALFECIWQKKWPSKFLLMAFILFIIGIKVLLK